jgi:Family of unknown function (DUF6492)
MGKAVTRHAPMAIITPSYEGDLERCKLLCESMDRLAQGEWQHYLLIADHDVPLFQSLTGPRRKIIPDSQMLPKWLKPVRQPFDKQRRWRWISTKLTRQVWPMTGWHVQQLRKMLVARHIPESVLVMADSDSVFVRPFGAQTFTQGDNIRLQMTTGEIKTDDDTFNQHVIWTKVANTLLDLPSPVFPADDFIHNLVSWRRDHALAMLERIERLSGTDIVTALGRHRTFSEYQIYGAFVTQVEQHAGHWASAQSLSLTYWDGATLTSQTLAAFVSRLAPDQIAICVQSFTDASHILRSEIATLVIPQDGDRSPART